MQPEMSFERGFCRPECTRCSEVCPAGAIHRITPQEKTDIHIGFAVLVPDNCLPYSTGVQCGNCARHCPADAILMVPKDKNADPDDSATVKVPSVNADKCIGCGACEYLCPSRPFSAIYVNGRERHV
jgi:ferredoxin